MVTKNVQNCRRKMTKMTHEKSPKWCPKISQTGPEKMPKWTRKTDQNGTEKCPKLGPPKIHFSIEIQYKMVEKKLRKMNQIGTEKHTK